MARPWGLRAWDRGTEQMELVQACRASAAGLGQVRSMTSRASQGQLGWHRSPVIKLASAGWGCGSAGRVLA